MTHASRFYAGLIALIVAQFLFLYVYLEAETAIQFWDYAMYANMALSWFSMPLGSFSLAFFQNSFSQNYNLLFAIPSYVAFSLFEPSRFVFILTNFVVFFLPYQAAIGLFLKRVFEVPWSKAFFGSFLFTSLFPPAWAPLLQGYPDHAAAACFLFGLSFFLKDKKTALSFLWMGLFLGLSIVLRRHYAYPVLSSLLVISLYELHALRLASKEAVKQLFLQKLENGVVAGAALVGVVLLFEYAYVRQVLQTSYLDLYKSYEKTPGEFILVLLNRSGLLWIGLALGGYGLAYKRLGPSRSKILFVFGLFFSWLGLWTLGPGQAGDHYMITLLPLFMVTGIAAYFVLPLKKAPLVSLAILLIMIVNAGNALWLAPFPLPSDEPTLRLLSSPRPPWIRKDKKDLLDLATYVKQTTSDKDRIAVVGSSFIFNQDLMRSLYVNELKDMAPAFRFIPTPEIDGQQEPPLDSYASANVFLVATPTQYHLAPKGQRVVSSLAKLFESGAAGEMKKDVRTFALSRDVTVSLWRREKINPEMLHKNLGIIRSVLDMPRRWIVTEQGGNFGFLKPYQNGFPFILQHPPGRHRSTLFLDQPLQAQKVELVADLSVQGFCTDLMTLSKVEDGAGRLIVENHTPLYQAEGRLYIPLSVSSKGKGPLFLFFSVETGAAGQGCTVAIKQLTLEQKL
ncbi:MAG: hypothetical protein AB7E52_03615 [Bdellovibrionales bacterium]